MGGGEEREKGKYWRREIDLRRRMLENDIVVYSTSKEVRTTYSRLLGGDRYRISALQGILLQLDHAIIILIRVFIGSTLRLPTD